MKYVSFLLIPVALLSFANLLPAQKKEAEYKLRPIYDLATSTVKSQGKTGSCWSFSTLSFLESEIYRISGQWVDLSEMYVVRNAYQDKTFNYVYRQGKAQFSEGGLAHDAINTIKKYGIVPEAIFSGKKLDDAFNHKGLDTAIRSYLDSVIGNQTTYPTKEIPQQLNQILDTRIGQIIDRFDWQGQSYTPSSYAASLPLQLDDYVTLTSFMYQPFHRYFVLDIPDNFSNGSYYNLPLDQYMEQIKHALSKGYTLALDADVSEKTFSAQYGMAIVPDDTVDLSNKKILADLYSVLYHEPYIKPERREKEFLEFKTTDDHLMHIVGLYQDQIGNRYYKVKNSWGDQKGNEGFVFMSESYIRLKSISVFLHKEAILSTIKL